jgi:hypothetical protein
MNNTRHEQQQTDEGSVQRPGARLCCRCWQKPERHTEFRMQQMHHRSHGLVGRLLGAWTGRDINRAAKLLALQHRSTSDKNSRQVAKTGPEPGCAVAVDGRSLRAVQLAGKRNCTTCPSKQHAARALVKEFGYRVLPQSYEPRKAPSVGVHGLWPEACNSNSNTLTLLSRAAASLVRCPYA